MKLTEIKTDLFTGVSLTDFGVRFEFFDKEYKEKRKEHELYPHGFFHYVFNLTNEGGLNINSQGFARLNIEQLNEICRVAGILKGGDKSEKYKFTESGRHSKDFKFAITENGHTMFPEDVVKELNQKEILLRENAELKKQNKELTEMFACKVEKEKPLSKELLNRIKK